MQFKAFQMLDEYRDDFQKTIKLDKNDSIYSAENEEQVIKLSLYLSSEIKALNLIHDNQNLYSSYNESTIEMVELLLSDVIAISSMYNVDDLQNGKIDIFNDNRFWGRSWGADGASLASLLSTINNFYDDISKKFISIFFNESNDLGKMLMAVKIFDSPDIVEDISNRINKVAIKDFINDQFTITSLIQTMTVAVNSDTHWDLAHPLLQRVQEHFAKRHSHDDTYKSLLFEIQLLLALKDKDVKKIELLSVKDKNQNNTKKKEKLKKYYMILYQVTYLKAYEKSLVLLRQLQSLEPENYRYAYLVYYICVQMYSENSDIKNLRKSKEEWDKFCEQKKDNEETHDYQYDSKQINLLHIQYSIAVDDPLLFDQCISNTIEKYLYDEELIPKIYNYYLHRSMLSHGIEYLIRAKMQLEKEDKEIPEEIIMLFKDINDPEYLKMLNNSMCQIMALDHLNLPIVIPRSINSANDIDTFILKELINSMRILMEKIHGIRQITHENRYNDLFIAILRLRFAVWGWDITDQSRTGDSETGIDAGETDIQILSSGIVISLIEAFILEGENKSLTQRHITKLFNYNRNIQRYFIIVYYRGSSSRFDNTWSSYQQNVLDAPYHNDYSINKEKGFISMQKFISDINNIKVGKTFHKNDISLFHLMIDLS